MQDQKILNSPTPIRVSQKTACQMLDLTPEGLRKIMAKDTTFPVPYKTGSTRQSAVYFDYAELVQWHHNQKQTYAVMQA